MINIIQAHKVSYRQQQFNSILPIDHYSSLDKQVISKTQQYPSPSHSQDTDNDRNHSKKKKK